LTAGNPGLGRPFIFGDTGTLVVSPVGSLDQGVAGSVDAQATNYFQSAGLRLRRNIYDGCSLRLDLLGGYRFYRMVDKVSVHEREVFLFDVGEFLQGDIRDVTDSFRAENQFHGGEIGLAANLRRGRWTLDLVSKAALGNSHEVVKIAGSTTITSPTGGSSTAETGLLVQDTNVGTHTRNEFAVIPQFSAELGYQVTCHFRAYVGYDFVYWTNVLRAGDQIDLRVDLPGTTEVSRFPEFAFHGSDFWAHGLRIGGEFRY
jgi:hypothetical protein